MPHTSREGAAYDDRAQPMSSRPSGWPENESSAVAGFVLGLLSVTCLGALAGLPAIVLGVVGRHAIQRSNGLRTGAGLAAGAIVTGFLGTTFSVILLALFMNGAFDDARPRRPQPAVAFTDPTTETSRMRTYGTLEIIDLDTRGPLALELEAIAAHAAAKRHVVVLQTYVRASHECADVATSLTDPRMRSALSSVTLVRVDVDVYERQLHAMRIETETVPWFYKVDSEGHLSDGLSADEWDDNTAGKMAPVLDAFVRGTLDSRRRPSPLGIEL